MQKVVALYLDNNGAQHGDMEEHLEDYLEDGWRVVSVTSAGGHSTAAMLRVFAVVVLEKASRDRAE